MGIIELLDGLHPDKWCMSAVDGTSYVNYDDDLSVHITVTSTGIPISISIIYGGGDFVSNSFSVFLVQHTKLFNKVIQCIDHALDNVIIDLDGNSTNKGDKTDDKVSSYNNQK